MFQISFSIRRKSPEVLNFKRIKVCKLSETPAEELVSGECSVDVHRVVVIQTTDNNPSNFSDSGLLFVMAGDFSFETTLKEQGREGCEGLGWHFANDRQQGDVTLYCHYFPPNSSSIVY